MKSLEEFVKGERVSKRKDKIVLAEIRGEELREIVPVLRLSILKPTYELEEKIVLEVMQKNKQTLELAPARWFKVRTYDFFTVLEKLMFYYFVHLLKKGMSFPSLVNRINMVVKKALKKARHEAGL
ncbi:MAG TPA: hypothetical protein ENG61_02105 [Candidatus Korarchaeota archaeon]|nr:hypothetical protein [Candidatus Korarchaeota archaeon]